MVTFNPGLSQILSKVFVSGIRMCNLSLQNTVVPSLRNKEMITQKVTVSNVKEGKYKKWDKILILD